MLKLLGLLAILTSGSAFANKLNAVIEFESVGAKPQYIRVNSSVVEHDAFQCTTIKSNNYHCWAELEFIAITDSFVLSVISQTPTMSLTLNSVKVF